MTEEEVIIGEISELLFCYIQSKDKSFERSIAINTIIKQLKMDEQLVDNMFRYSLYEYSKGETHNRDKRRKEVE